jgi:hypothetical protein
MKNQLSFVLFLALSAGTLATSAVAQDRTQINDRESARVEFATFDPSQASGLLRQAGWDDHRRCDGDHDRDDWGCYYRAWRGPAPYPATGFYGGHYAAPYVAPNYGRANGWYDRNGYWHAYDRDRDRDRRRHDDDDRR